MTDYKTAYETVISRLENHYHIPVDTDASLGEGDTGDFDGSKIMIDKKLDTETALFVLLHVFGHTVQWCISDELRKLGLETVNSATDEQLEKIFVYEREASQYGLELLIDSGITDMDRWISIWWYSDWAWLSHFYKTGEKLDPVQVQKDTDPTTVPSLVPLVIPHFEPQQFETRSAFGK